MASRLTALALGLAIVLATGVAHAVAPADPQCLREATEQRDACRLECNDELIAARDVCRDIDPFCASDCRAASEECKEPFLTARSQCLAACGAELGADKAACPKPGDPGRAACVAVAQGRASICRGACRQDPLVLAGMKACAATLAACISGCPPPGGGGPPQIQ